MLMEKNEVYIGTCTGYNEDGAGVVRIEGIVLFVNGLLMGETAEIGIMKMKKNYGYGRVVRLIEASEHRCTPRCTVYRQCGGCTLQHMDDAEQRRFKEEKVKLCFRANAGMEIEPLPILRDEPVWNYRNKVQIPCAYEQGRVKMGFYRTHTNDIVPYDACMVQTDLSNELTDWFRKHLGEAAKQVRHVLIKHAHMTDQVMVVLVVRKYPFVNSEAIIDQLVHAYKNISSVVVIVNKREDNVILDGQEICVYGNPYIEEELLGCRFRISARSFYQINPYMTKRLYETAIEYAGLTGKEILIDLYCGTGTMGLIASSKAKKVYGIEIVPEAVKDAEKNAEINGIENIRFLNMDASKGAQAMIRSKIKADAVIVDPPRKGCSKETLDAIVTISPERLVYVSCDPATLARDVAILREKGYELEKVQPVDMFPQTTHVETVVLLSKGEIDSKKVRVEFSLEDMDMSDFQDKATYTQIKDYVLEHSGLKVSNLYISQIKRKCGLEVGKNYNLPKAEDSRQPQCPPEKENAIREAMKYFGMI